MNHAASWASSTTALSPLFVVVVLAAAAASVPVLQASKSVGAVWKTMRRKKLVKKKRAKRLEV